ncbi:MAG: chorismate synthase [Clostridia bacterium]|nr:chorismate synthase [Clostridia bacterium]
MSSEYGKNIKISIFGESHGKAIGVSIDGIPAGEEIDMDTLLSFMARRAPGRSKLATKRCESDTPVFLSGLTNGITNGFPICAIIENSNAHSSDYAGFEITPRPSHADYVASLRYNGFADMRGSGHFSGRLTASLCIAGGIAKQILAKQNIFVGAHISSICNVKDSSFPLYPTSELFNEIASKEIAVIDDEKGEKMRAVIEQAASECDSVGGTVECAVVGFPASIGSPMFDGIENRLALALFGIPAVKGLEFGSGFSASETKGSQNNDAFEVQNGKVVTKTNNNGGIIGGISNGMPITLRVAFKPTPSIAKKQETVNLETLENTTISIGGRHDPCIVLRAVAVVEAVVASVMLDLLQER